MRALTLAALALMRAEVMSSFARDGGVEPSDRWALWDKKREAGTQRPYLMRVRHEARVDSVGGT